MICSKCGAELKEGCVFCSQCGQEVQIVSEINLLEDDLLRQLMDEVDAEKETSSTEKLLSEEERKAERERRKNKEKQKKRAEQKRKKMIRAMIITIVILVAAVIAVVCFVHYQHSNSTEYLFGKAQTAYNQKNYVEAEKYLDQVLALDAEHPDALLMDGQIALAQNDYETAEERFLAVIAQDEANADAYEGLIAAYEAQGKTDEILALKENVTDEDILTLFADYIVGEPEFSEESGTFSDYFTVEITVPEKKLDIYYTLDGTTPTNESERYEDPIEISEEGTTVLTAVCVDENGIYSEPVRAEYNVELEAPDAPTVSPDSGRFSMATTVTIQVESGTTVYYTWDGTTPTKSSNVYTGPIEIPEGNNVLSVIAYDKNGKSSSVMKYNYVYYAE